MKILGDEYESDFRFYAKEPGIFFGSNEVLKKPSETVTGYDPSCLETPIYSKTIKPKLYLHIPKDGWTTFTGILREHLLPWRWKTAYLDKEDGSEPRQILVCPSPRDVGLPQRLKEVLGKSLFVSHLIDKNFYSEIFGKEYVCLEGENKLRVTRIEHRLGSIIGLYYFPGDTILYCHIYRSRSVFSKFKYHLLKHFSSSWKEVAVQVGQTSEKFLIKKCDEEVISLSGLKSGIFIS